MIPFLAVAGGDQAAATSSVRAHKDLNARLFSSEHEIARVTQSLAARLGLPPIAYVGWFPGDEINAFAIGKSQRSAMILFSQGAVERLTKQEFVAVIAHELGHVAGNDMARMTHARSIQEALTFFLIFRGLKQFARWIFTPLSELEILRMSRAREFTADRIAALLLGPGPMISALERLQAETVCPQRNDYANLMMWSGLKGGAWLSTHPPINQRIARLRTLASAHGFVGEMEGSESLV